jgi:formate-dependent nitrite reductase membrane component NrfD
MRTIKEKLNILAGVILLPLLIYLFVPRIIELPRLDYSSGETMGVLFFDIVFLILIIWVAKYLYKEIKK